MFLKFFINFATVYDIRYFYNKRSCILYIFLSFVYLYPSLYFQYNMTDIKIIFDKSSNFYINILINLKGTFLIKSNNSYKDNNHRSNNTSLKLQVRILINSLINLENTVFLTESLSTMKAPRL